MGALKSYITAVSDVLNIHKRMILGLYLVNLVFALVIALPLNSLVKDNIGDSLLYTQLQGNRDYTLFTEFMRHFGLSIDAWTSQSWYVIILFLLMMIFLMGGIISSVILSRDKSHSFISESSLLFSKMIRITFYFLLLLLILLFILWLIYNSAELNIFNVENDDVYVRRWKIFIPLTLIVIFMVDMYHDYVKVFTVKNEHRYLFRNFKEALNFIFKNFRSALLLFIINAVVALSVYYIFSHVISSSLTWILIFITGQVLLILRIAIKVINLSSIHHFIDSKS